MAEKACHAFASTTRFGLTQALGGEAECETVKACPYCKEEVQSEAIKCRFCHSMLLPVATPEVKQEDQSRVTYILDRDLVRFAKFAGAVLAVFLVVGAYLFGFKLEAALEKVRSAQDELKTTQEKLTEAQSDLESAKRTVKGLKADVEALLAEAKSTLGDISAQRETAVALVVSIRELSAPEAATLQRARVDQPDKLRRDSRSKYWTNGATIRVMFIDGDPKAQAEVVRFAKMWIEHANLKFDFVTSGDSEVRVSFKRLGAWSFLGTDAVAVPKDQPTINLQWVDRRTVLHEFGHVLGLIEEHLNPRAKIAWKEDLIYRELGGPPNMWSRDTIEANVFRQVSVTQLGDYREFDPSSIMTMKVPKEWTGGIALGGSEDLSESDKALVARIYPR